MSTTLIATAALVGLAGMPHCAAMCGAPCAALTGARRPALAGFLLTRAAGYIAAGALLAGGSSAIGAWSRDAGVAAAGLRGLWIALHAAALAWGLAMLWLGRQPRLAWLAWPKPAGTMVIAWAGGPSSMHTPPRRAPVAFTSRSALAGALWWAWPCGLLQSALVLAVLGNTAADGALVMAAFALASSAGLWWGPRLWQRLVGARGADRGQQLAVRAAGALLVVAAAVALWHDARGGSVGLLCW